MSSVQRFSLILPLVILCFCCLERDKTVQPGESQLLSFKIKSTDKFQVSYIFNHSIDIDAGHGNVITHSLKEFANTSRAVVATAMDIKGRPGALVHLFRPSKKQI